MLWADSPGRCQAFSGQDIHPNILLEVPDQATALQCGTFRSRRYWWWKQQPPGCDHLKIQSDLVKLRAGLRIFLHSHGLWHVCGSSNLKLFPQVPAARAFCSGGSQVSPWHVGWDARYNRNSWEFSWILQKCFFFPPMVLSSQLQEEILCVFVSMGAGCTYCEVSGLDELREKWELHTQKARKTESK